MEPTDKRFRIAFSFAGEKRDFVAQVAAILARQFGKDKILYDKYHAPEFSRSDLAFYLPNLYEQEAELVVVVFCPDYENKEWCGLEWNAVFGLLKKRNVNEVMLSFDLSRKSWPQGINRHRLPAPRYDPCPTRPEAGSPPVCLARCGNLHHPAFPEP